MRSAQLQHEVRPTTQHSARVALVTGAARRVGRAIALELASAGFDLGIHFHTSAADAQQTRDRIASLGRRACLISADISRPESWPQIVSSCVGELGRLDVLVNNASTFDAIRLEDFTVEAWERTMRVNLTAVAGLSHHAAPYLAASGAGCMVNLCDIAADRPFREHLAYSCAKAGLVALTEALAVDLAPNVRVNGVSPGIAVFPENYDAPTRERLIAQVPLMRAGTPEDIAKAVRYLVDAPYVTGEILRVDGGRSVRW